LIGYIIVSVMVYATMTSLGELATYMPISGSFSTYASKYVDPALGFAIGWNYWFQLSLALRIFF
jgi:lysine-specific permease